MEDAVATDLQRATGLATSNKDTGTTRRTLQLTGLSDAVYAEAVVILHQYDVVLDVLVINRTNETLQNLCLELATTGDLKLVERPQNHTLAAGQSTRLRANIKVCHPTDSPCKICPYTSCLCQPVCVTQV